MYDFSLLQEEDLQEIVTKISSKRVEFDEARAQMAKHKVSYDEAEREYKQHKEQINTVAEEADSKKVKTADQPRVSRCFVTGIKERFRSAPLFFMESKPNSNHNMLNLRNNFSASQEKKNF